jgi:hypothetical protein
VTTDADLSARVLGAGPRRRPARRTSDTATATVSRRPSIDDAEVGRRSTGAGGQWLPGRERTGRMNQSTAPAGAAAAGRAGYSGTVLVRKIGVKPGARLVLAAAPAGWEIPELPAGVERLDLAEPPPVEAFAQRAGGAPAPAGAAGIGPDVEQGPAGLGSVDVVVAFCRASADVTASVHGFAGPIRPAGALWIAWPRRAAGHRSDVTENLIREVALPLGLVDTKVAALDADWSGLRIVWRRERR